MRKSQYSREDIEQIELDEVNRRAARASGFDLMHTRDAGWAAMTNGCTIHWHVNRDLKDGEARTNVPDGKLIIRDGDRELYFDAEELRSYLRWA